MLLDFCVAEQKEVPTFSDFNNWMGLLAKLQKQFDLISRDFYTKEREGIQQCINKWKYFPV